ncbi:hypothetical protein CHUAL_005218 [Chamberlinius hualienensis]
MAAECTPNDENRLSASMDAGQAIVNETGQEKKPILETQRRYACNHMDFREKYHFVKTDRKTLSQTVGGAAKKSCSNCTEVCSSNFWWKFAKKRLPVLDWVQYYSIKQNLLCDVIAGLTVGVMHIPQGMAYAMLADVPPVLGLYVSLFPVILYVFMGTSRHISIGTFAVICLMLSKSVDKLANKPDFTPAVTLTVTPNHTSLIPSNITEAVDFSQATYSPVEVVVVVCFVVGIIQILMGLLHLGALSVYLSDTLISGFTTGAAMHVFTSQVKNLFGFQIPVRNGMLKIVHTYIDIFTYADTANYVAIIISALTIVLLMMVNEFINPRMKAKFKIPLPMELLVIVFGTLSSYFIQLQPNYNVKVIGYIPTGLPYPKEPRFELMSDVIADSFAIAIVCFTIAMSMAKLFAKKHKYDIYANQELLAMGIANVISSFFSCFPCSASLSRSLIQEGTGGKTQVAGLVSCVFLLIIILVVGPLFESLPNCILSSIIVVALKGMFMQFRDLKAIWNISKLEGAVWLATFFGVVLTDVDIGLAIGLGASFLAIVIRTQRPYACLVGLVPYSELYLDVSRYQSAEEELGIKVYRFGSAIYYANRDYFRNELYRLTDINPHLLQSKHERMKTIKQIEKEKTMNGNELSGKGDVNEADMIAMALNPSPDELKNPNEEIIIVGLHHIILDGSMWSFIDVAGINTIVQIIHEYKEIGIHVLLCGCPDTTLDTIEKHSSYSEFENRIFPTISDAKAHIRHGQFLTGLNQLS